jgi:hypothetical protein
MLRQLGPQKATAIFYGQIMGLKVASCQLKVFSGQISRVLFERERTGFSPTGLI